MVNGNHLGEFEQLALLSVLRLGAEAYGARIQEDLETTAGRTAAISTIYITLARLETKGLVRSSLGSPTDERGGRRRRYYQVEVEGLVALNEARVRLLSMWDGVEEELEKVYRAAHGQ